MPIWEVSSLLPGRLFLKCHRLLQEVARAVNHKNACLGGINMAQESELCLGTTW